MLNSDFWCGRNTFFFGSRYCAAALFSQVPKKCTDLDLSLLYILVLGTCSKFARNFLAPSLCFLQPSGCLSAGRRFAASRSCLQNYWRIVSFPQQKKSWTMKCVVDCIPQRICFRSKNTQPNINMQPISFGVSFLQSRISTDNLVLSVSFATFWWKETR